MRFISFGNNRQQTRPFHPEAGKIKRPPRFDRNISVRRVFKGLTLSACIFLVIAGTAFLYQRMCTWDFFQITVVDFTGMKKTTENELRAASGVDVHTNLLALKSSRVKEALEKHPWVAQATVNRSWPNRLYITVKEKVPVAMINRKDGLFYLDEKGKPFWQVTTSGDLDYPVLTGNFPDADGETESLVLEALSFLRVARSINNDFLSEQSISEIHFNKEKGMIVYLLDRKFPTYLGTGEIKTKYNRLASILEGLYRKEEVETIAFIDMNYMPDQVLVSRNNKKGKG